MDLIRRDGSRITQFLRVAASVSALFLAACGGGGGGGGIVGGGGGIVVVDASVGGIWEGTATSDLEPGVVYTVVGIATEDGRLRLFVEDLTLIVDAEASQLAGNLTTDGDDVSGDVQVWASLGFTFANGETTDMATFSGTVDERTSLSGTWTASTGETGTFDLTYLPLYERGSSLAAMEGMWTSFDENDNPYGNYMVDANGNITGSDVQGCQFSGAITIIDAAYNVYEVTLTISMCGALDGQYSGLGGLDISNVNDTFVFQIDNGQTVLTVGVLKQ